MNKPVILCVDDEKLVLIALKEQLRTEFNNEFIVELAESGEEALEILAKLSEEGFEIPVIIADHLMPGIKGDELLIRTQAILPATLKIMLTGQANAEAVGNAVNKARLYRYITKPWDRNDLVLTIREALKSYKMEKYLCSINTVSRKINAIHQPDELLKCLLSESINIADAAGGGIFLVNEETGILVVNETQNLDDTQVSLLGQLAHQSFVAAKTCIQFLDKQTFQLPVLAVPIVLKGIITGVLCLFRDQVDCPFTSDDGEIHGIFMTEAAIALENALLFRKRSEVEDRLKEIIDAIIETMALTLEKKDPYTAGHQRRVADLAQAIAKEMGLPEEMVDGIKVAGIIHDIGKIAIPTEILSKPGKLDDEEFPLIKKHPLAGYDVLKKIAFPWPVAEIVYQHHERLDGLGYPRGLKEKDIMLEAKIISCADVIEAIASHRPYRAALGLDVALAEISNHRGDKYDSSVVDACLRLFKERGYVLKGGISG